MRQSTFGTPERVLAGGLCTLIIAMGIGRFAYTPILPAMQSGVGMTYAEAGLLASLNYAGYLIGALGAGFLRAGIARTLSFRAALVICIGTTGLMAAADTMPGWGALRLLSGAASGALFVIGADIVMRVLAQSGQSRLSGVHFSGVGVGIALTGFLVPPLEAFGGWRSDWIGLAILSLVIAVPAWLWLRDTKSAADGAASPRSVTACGPTAVAFPLMLLALVYFLEGFGYIVSGTFLVSILQLEVGSGLVGPLAWAVVGLAAAPSCLFWSLAAERWGYLPALILAHLLQAIGIVLPVISGTLGSALIGAALFGGTFMGITTMVIAFGRKSARGSPVRAIGLLTAAFGLGQILGPLSAGWLTGRSGNFNAALILATAAVLLGAALLGAGIMLAKPPTDGEEPDATGQFQGHA